MARPMRSKLRASGRFSRREMVDCEHSSRSDGDKSSAILKMGIDGIRLPNRLGNQDLTALLLATMTAKGQVALEAPVGRYLPVAAGSGTRFIDLATHTSGYPRITRGVKARMLLRLRDPYALVRDRDVDRSLRRLSRNLGPDRTRSNTPTSAMASCHVLWRRPVNCPSANCCARRSCGPSTSGS